MPRKYSLLENHSLTGFWWEPDKPDLRIPGSLTYESQRHMRLELFDASKLDDVLALNNQLAKFEILHGIVYEKDEQGKTSSKIITLFNVNQERGTVGIFGPSLSIKTFWVEYAFIGIWFENPADISFDDITAEFQDIEYWLVPDVIKPIYDDTKYRIETSFEGPFSYNIESIESEFRISGSMDLPIGRNRKRVELEFIPLIGLKTVENVSFQHFEENLKKASQLLTILSGYPIYLKSIEGSLKGLYSNKPEIPAHFNILYIQKIHSKWNIKESDIMVPYTEIEDFGKILNLWYSNYKSLDVIVNLYLETVYSNGHELKTLFLLLAQAIETYHRKRVGGEYVKRDDYIDTHFPTIKNALPENLPKDLKDRAIQMLEYVYEFSLSKRLKELFRNIGPDLTSLITKDYKRFASKIVATRNYYTHYDDAQAEKALSSDDKLFVGVQKLKALLIVLFLKELSFNDMQISSAINRHVHFGPLIEYDI